MKFKQVYIEITNKCNLNCPFCPNDTLEKHEMNLENIDYILNEVKDYTDTVCLHIQGEPLLHSSFLSVVGLCHEYGLNINLTTNGVLINKLLEVLRVYQNFKMINISLQAMVNFKDNKEFYVENINYFLEYKNRHFKNIPVNLRLWNDKTTDVNKEINDYSKNLFKHIVLNHHIYNTRISENDEFTWPTLDLDVNEIESGCLGGKDQLGILVDGRVVLCCLDYLGHTNLGNIFESSLEEILHSDKYLRSIKGFNDRKPYLELCKKCTYRNRFVK